jgi:Holliday junction DNA helicase RuvB
MEELKRIVLNQETEEDQVVSLSLRPERLDDFVGQPELIKGLKVAIIAAQKRGEPMEHTLFSGPPGLGKTSLAHIIANEMDTHITVTSGPAISRSGDLMAILTNLTKGDVLFIDEIHRLPKTVEEFLYPAIEDFKIDFIIDKNTPYAKTINFPLKPFTLIGATTRSGLLTTPLRDRFGIFYHLEFYSHDALSQIISTSAGKLNVEIDNDACLAMARRSRGTPRIANRLLRRCRDWAQVNSNKNHIDLKVVDEAMLALRIDAQGLDELDRRLLMIIKTQYKGGPVGLEALAATLNEETDTIEDVIEPYLLKTGFLRRTSRGRELTAMAVDHLSTIKRVNG